MASLYNRAKVNTATAGTGTMTLGAATSNAFFTFAEAGVPDGTVVSYVIEDGTDVEMGIGTYTASGTTLSRTTVTASKIAGVAGTTKLTLSGSAIVYIDALAADIVPVGFSSVSRVQTENRVLPANHQIDVAQDYEISSGIYLELGSNALLEVTGPFIGQFVFANAASISMVTATAKTMAQIVLTAGDWDLFGFFQNDTGTMTAHDFCFSTVDNTLQGGYYGNELYTIQSAGAVSMGLGPYRVSLTTQTVYYLVARVSFASTLTMAGYINARQIR